MSKKSKNKKERRCKKCGAVAKWSDKLNKWLHKDKKQHEVL